MRQLLPRSSPPPPFETVRVARQLVQRLAGLQGPASHGVGGGGGGHEPGSDGCQGAALVHAALGLGGTPRGESRHAGGSYTGSVHH